MTGTFLCHEDQLAPTGAKGVVLDPNGANRRIMLVHKDGVVFAYQNVCPHARMPLEFRDDHFFDVTRKFILCSVHGALFEIETGRCVSGPCVGQGLVPVRIDRRGEDIYLADEDDGSS